MLRNREKEQERMLSRPHALAPETERPGVSEGGRREGSSRWRREAERLRLRAESASLAW